MARPWRIEYEGTYYHILSHGYEGRDIFYDHEDRKIFLNTVGETSDRFEIDVFAFILMPNHYHILLRTNQANLSKAMQWLGVTYTRRFNNRHCLADPATCSRGGLRAYWSKMTPMLWSYPATSTGTP
jgi:REP element-mobilizing transposase RayT